MYSLNRHVVMHGVLECICGAQGICCSTVCVLVFFSGKMFFGTIALCAYIMYLQIRKKSYYYVLD